MTHSIVAGRPGRERGAAIRPYGMPGVPSAVTIRPGARARRRAGRMEGRPSVLDFKRPETADGSHAAVDGAAAIRPNPAFRGGGAAFPQPGRVRLRTLVLLRWLAVGGQAAALLIVYGVLGYRFPIGLAFVGVAVSAWLNIVLMARYPSSRRLS